MHSIFLWLDPYLIWFYRLTGYAPADFIIGTFVLALIAVIMGECTISLAYLLARKRIEKVTDETIRYQNLSIDALTSGNKEAYRAANELANDAFGHSFFMQIALSAAFLWPICFALAWMSQRFEDLEFPVPYLHFSLGYIAVFLFLFVAAYFVFKPVKYRIPYFRRIKEMLKASSLNARKLNSFGDLLSPAGAAKPGGEKKDQASPSA
ncbi:MAG: hypothetical protein KKD99_04680 [Proteobacteria bacterium]|nr:hypothetical protein [Pseudomonadota bacterium]MBU4357285.1 hypothetical protein [Pseudomonadota bacterium]MBU4447863.1 hypothetical protein [Pseudomonadota bacterium]MCG2773792.1 hypothetical protein [Desulfobacterales bacterium]